LAEGLGEGVHLGFRGVSGAGDRVSEHVGGSAEGEGEDKAVPGVEDFDSGRPVADRDDGDAGEAGEGDGSGLDAVFGSLRAVRGDDAVHAFSDSPDKNFERGRAAPCGRATDDVGAKELQGTDEVFAIPAGTDDGDDVLHAEEAAIDVGDHHEAVVPEGEDGAAVFGEDPLDPREVDDARFLSGADQLEDQVTSPGEYVEKKSVRRSHGISMRKPGMVALPESPDGAQIASEFIIAADCPFSSSAPPR
jgi:hypothetical protein